MCSTSHPTHNLAKTVPRPILDRSSRYMSKTGLSNLSSEICFQLQDFGFPWVRCGSPGNPLRATCPSLLCSLSPLGFVRVPCGPPCHPLLFSLSPLFFSGVPQSKKTRPFENPNRSDLVPSKTETTQKRCPFCLI